MVLVASKLLCRLHGTTLANTDMANDNYNLDSNKQKALQVLRNEMDVDGSEDKIDTDCGNKCQNRLHELGHPKEHSRCLKQGQVIDIWGYCR